MSLNAELERRERGKAEKRARRWSTSPEKGYVPKRVADMDDEVREFDHKHKHNRSYGEGDLAN